MSRKALLVAHVTLTLTSPLGLSSAHSPTSHPRSLSCAAATLGRSVASVGRSRTLEICHLSPVRVQTIAKRLDCFVPVGAVRSTVPSSRQISGRRNLSDCTRILTLEPFISGRDLRNRAAILSLPWVCLPDSSM